MHRDENLLRQVNDAYRPIDLFDSEKDHFFCPKCNKQLSISSARTVENKFSKSLVQASCAECRERLYFKLPEIKKKRVYLDQSVISDLCVLDVAGLNEIGSIDWRERLLAKILLAKRLQKANFIVSEIHVQETVPIPDEDTQKACWRLANSLADGKISGNFIDAFEYELHQVLGIQSENKHSSPLNCYMDFEIDAWSIRSPILMTNFWQLRLNHNQINFRHTSKENFKKILIDQQEQVGLNATVESCIQYLKKLYLKDIVDAIKYAQNFAAKKQQCDDWYESFQANVDAPPPSFIDIQVNKNGYTDIIIQTTLDLKDTSNQIKMLSKLLDRVESQGIDAFPSIKIHAVLEGEVLHRWVSGLQANPKGFNKNYGSSKFMDISHLAVFLPVVDVLTVDKDTFNRCTKDLKIQLEFAKYPRKLLRASENQSGLENWLNDLIAQPESDEFRCTRRLFFGRNLAEQKCHEDQFISEIIDRFEREKQSSA